MKIGIVGLPNVGKSTLFNSITKAGAECANYPFCTIEPNVGMVTVPDERIEKLTEIYKPEKTTYATIEFVDIAGLVKGASKGEGLGNKFLSHIREVDSIAHVVRCFENENIVHVDGAVDPIRDIETINLELCLADLETVEKRLDRAKKSLKADKKFQIEVDVWEKIKLGLEAGTIARKLELNDEEKEIIKDSFLLTMKPVLYVGNISEDEIENPNGNSNIQKLTEYAKKENAEVIPLCIKIEEELSGLEKDDKNEMLEALGLKESGLDKLIKASYKLLGLMSFLTAGEPEVRAWTIKIGTKAPQAAGKIHSDIERGFIRAEVISYEDFIDPANGSMVTAKEKGLVRSEGKEYVMKDGDIVLFRFNV
ncbi:MAG: redox-regulated ATPase YchF [Clostridia bacterium]|nr:redox-regulated ATPase YchF [Clostridia bacterium]